MGNLSPVGVQVPLRYQLTRMNALLSGLLGRRSEAPEALSAICQQVFQRLVGSRSAAAFDVSICVTSRSVVGSMNEFAFLAEVG